MAGKKIKVLVIDDDPDNCIMLKELVLQKFPAFRVVTASGGNEGIAFAHKEDPDVILLDIIMPEMNGYEVCRKLKAATGLRDIPVVLISALEWDRENRIAALEAGVDGFLAKPIDETEFVAQIKAMVKIKAAHVRDRDNREVLEQLVAERTRELHRELSEKRKAESELLFTTRRLNAFWDIATLHNADLRTTCDHLLASIVMMTDSTYGFFGFLSGDESVMTIDSWSGEAMTGCSIVDKPTEFVIKDSGVWAEAVRLRQPLIINNFAAAHPGKKGLPVGHVTLQRLLVIPIFTGDKIVSVAAVANRSGDYTEVDVKQIGAFAENVQLLIARKHAERALRESEQRFRTIFDGAPLGISVIDSVNGHFLETNPRFSEIVGHTHDLLIGIDWMSITHPDDIREDVEKMALMRAGRIPGFSIQKRYMLPDGTCRWVNKTVAPLPVGSDGRQCHLAMVEDITEKRAIELRLRQSEKMEAIGQLAGGIAHDFNNVLGGIIGYTDMSLDLAEKGSMLDKNLRKVIKAADRAKNLVQQILTFSRQGGHKKTVVALRPIVKEVMELLRASIPTTVTIEADLKPDVKPVLADPTQVHEMLLNLATNAVHAMERKGTLTIRLFSEVPAKSIDGRIGPIVPGEYAVLEVRDDGCGMDAALLEKAFDPFFTTKPVGEGTGMGLSVVLGIVQSHGGDLQVESKPGKGTLFRFFLPVTNENGDSAGQNEPLPPFGGNERILFVDDEKTLVEVAGEQLGHYGYRVTGMSNSLKAFRFLTTHSAEIDVLITDQTMPGMTGAELAGEALRIRSDLPIILCTGYSSEINESGAIRLGIRRMLQKPIRAQELATAIREIFDKNE